jgi:hypothetical protein
MGLRKRKHAMKNGNCGLSVRGFGGALRANEGGD